MTRLSLRGCWQRRGRPASGGRRQVDWFRQGGRLRLEELEGRLAPAGYGVRAGWQVSSPDGLAGGGPARQVVFFEPAVTGYEVLLRGLGAGE
jgi:hypothetical protein